ncbi:SMI1/KNR4 family protein, partial [Chryseobacterium sp.]|uniref:SMI1/KNR4 family protein n=1 Tax=Chryseobacterium sp. TaxID=1871047 RepID=UPI00321A2AF6
MNYLEKIERLYQLSNENHSGFSETEITAAEQALDFKFPAVLREYYLNIGKNEAVNHSHNRLLSPNTIYFTEDRHLVFYEENQGVVQWGIREADLSIENPSVWGNYGTVYESDWQQETQTLEDFFLSMSVYNGTLGGLLYNANSFSPVNTETVKFIQQNWSEIPEISWDRQKVYTDDYFEVISLSFDEADQCTAVFVGTSI